MEAVETITVTRMNPSLSVVGTLYGSEPYVDEFIDRCIVAAESVVGSDFEIVLVDDGGRDHALARAVSRARSDHRIRVVELSRNFGHHAAITAGLTDARGEKVFLIDTDLEEQPEWLQQFFHEMKSQQTDVVYGVQVKRKGAFVEREFGRLSYVVLRLLSGEDLPRDVVIARLMTREYVTGFLEFTERTRYLGGLLYLAGYRQIGVEVEKLSREGTTYSLSRRAKAFVDAVISFTNRPLTAIFYMGILVSLFSVALIAKALFDFFIEKPLSGWTSLVISIWATCGLVMLSIGILGLYIGRVYEEAKRRPIAIVRATYQFGGGIDRSTDVEDAGE